MFNKWPRVPFYPDQCPQCLCSPYPIGEMCPCGYIGPGPRGLPPQPKPMSGVLKVIGGGIIVLGVFGLLKYAAILVFG